jgi:hypothetical protein
MRYSYGFRVTGYELPVPGRVDLQIIELSMQGWIAEKRTGR